MVSVIFGIFLYNYLLILILYIFDNFGIGVFAFSVTLVGIFGITLFGIFGSIIDIFSFYIGKRNKL